MDRLLAALAPAFSAVYTVTPATPRAMQAQELARRAEPLLPPGKVRACADLSQALDLALMQPQGAVICGSLYLAAEARPLLLARLEKTADGLP